MTDPLDARWQKILPALDALARKKSDEIHAARQATPAPDEITFYGYEPVQPSFPPFKEGDILRVIQQTPDGPIERRYVAGPPAPADDILTITQRLLPERIADTEYEVAP